jgi:hypothetical protein
MRITIDRYHGMFGSAEFPIELKTAPLIRATRKVLLIEKQRIEKEIACLEKEYSTFWRNDQCVTQ